MSLAKPQGVVLDVDGLLVDTEELYYQTFNETLSAHGAGLARDGYAPYVGHPVEENSRTAVRQYHLNLTPEAFCAEWMRRFEEAISDPAQVRLMAGAVELVTFLGRKPYRLALASSTPRHRMRKTLQNGLLPRLKETVTLEDLFEVILSRDEVTHPKPDPEVYLLAAARLGLAPASCLVLEDSQAGIQAGKAAGMVVVAVPNRYTESQDHSAADLQVGSLTELLEKGIL